MGDIIIHFFRPTFYIADIFEGFTKENISYVSDLYVKITGRVLFRRSMGSVCFLDIQDSSGRIQVYVNKSIVTDGIYSIVKSLNIGDIIGVGGIIRLTKVGEVTLFADYIECITKTLIQFPDKWNKLIRKDLCHKKRYLDLIVNTASKDKFLRRIRLVTLIRGFFLTRKFLEVETPMLHPIPGGASARPFITYHNTLKSEFYLRVAPELYLKKLIVGGFDRVFEINRNFRNEGISYKHNPEFTMLEFYQSYSTYEDLMVVTEELMVELVFGLFNCYTICYKDFTINFKRPFNIMSFNESIIKYNSRLTLDRLCCREYLIEVIKENTNGVVDISLLQATTLYDLQVLLFDLTVEKNLIQPTFIVEYPIEVSPLAKRNITKPTLADRFELFIGGFEIANGFSELTDPIEQKIRFEQQVKNKSSNAVEDAYSFCDYSYIECLEYGMPPTAGEGIGIDRLAMLFTNSTTIKDVILFPV